MTPASGIAFFGVAVATERSGNVLKLWVACGLLVLWGIGAVAAHTYFGKKDGGPRETAAK
jgi:hypothetical protein